MRRASLLLGLTLLLTACSPRLLMQSCTLEYKVDTGAQGIVEAEAIYRNVIEVTDGQDYILIKQISNQKEGMYNRIVEIYIDREQTLSTDKYEIGSLRCHAVN
jgi:hypothetical protein